MTDYGPASYACDCKLLGWANGSGNEPPSPQNRRLCLNLCPCLPCARWGLACACRYRYFGGDDAVAVKSGWNWAGINFALPSENILVRHAVSAGRGGYTIGSEMSGGVRNVTFTDSVSTGQSGIRISSELGRGGYVKDITFCNLQFSWQAVQGKTFLFHINQAYTPDNRNTTLSYFDSITFENITAVGPSDLPIGDFTCLPASPCTHFRLTNITVRGSRESYSCNFVRGNATDCSPHPCINGSTDAAVTIGSLVAAHGAERA